MRFSLVALVLSSSLCVDLSAKEIPLDQVLGHRLPGTQPLSEVDPDSNDVVTWEKRTTKSPYVRFCQALESHSKASLHKSFVVEGTSLEALMEAERLLTEDGEPAASFSTEDQLYLVFFCRMSARYVELDRIEKHPKKIEVIYRQHAHSTTNMTCHFGLIPLGKIEPGEYQIVIEQLPTTYDEPEGRTWPEKADDSRICDSSEFTVHQPE